MLKKCWEMIPTDIAKQINPSMFAYIVGVVFTLMKTREGMAEVVNAQLEPGDYLKQYFSRNGMGLRGNEIDPRALVKFTGYLFRNGKATSFIHPSLIEEINDPALEECEAERIRLPRGYCVIPVRGTNNITYNLSNKARMLSENQTIKSTADTKVCMSCRYSKCPYNPDHSAPPKRLEHKPLPGMVL